MKRKSLFFFLMLALGTPWAAKAQTTLNISSQANWDTFASNPGNYTTVNLNTNDVTVTSSNMVGSASNPFTGIFNGNGHTLNVDIQVSGAGNDSQGAAPFKYISGATIKNLKVTGTVSSSAHHASGLVGFTSGDNNTIENCLVSTNVECTASHIGGIVGHGTSATIEMRGCVFAGELSATNTSWDSWVGGLQGWCDGGANLTFKNCFVNCTYSNVVRNFHPIGFKNNTASITVSIINCYYLTDIFSNNGSSSNVPNIDQDNIMNNVSAYCIPKNADNKGKHAYSIAGGTDVTVAMSGTPNNNSASGITTYASNNGMSYNDGTTTTLYAGKDDAVNLLLSYEGNQQLDNYSTSAGSLSGTAVTGTNDAYTLTMPSSAVTISATTSVPTYIKYITSSDEWKTFCKAVNDGHDYYGETVELANDITVGSQNDPITSTDYMVGNIDHPFRGTFNGQNHKLTIYLSSSEEGCAPFHYINGATIQNLEVAGKVTATSHHAGGLVGFAGNTTPHYDNAPLEVYNTIYNCHVSTDVTNNSGNFIGGIIGHNKNVCTTIEGCVYDGKLTSTGYKGGMIGWSDRSTLTVNNSCFGGDYSTSNNFSPIGCKTHTQNDNPVSLVLTFNNFYYNKDAGTFDNNDYNAMTGASVTGAAKHAYTVTGSGANVALSGTPNEYSVSGITSYTSNKGLLYNGTIIAGESDNVALALNGSPTGLYQANHGTLTASGAAWILAMAAYDTEISVLPFTKTIEAYGNSERGGYYLIASPLAADVDPATVGMITDNLGNTATTATGTYDLYSFDQAVTDEWQNYRTSTFNLVNGTGYLYASKNGTTLTFSGAPYSGNGQVTLHKTAAATGLDFPAWNLVGNPFAQTAYFTNDFYTLNEDRNEVVAGTTKSVEAMEGIFVVATNDGESMTFSTTPLGKSNSQMSINVVRNRGNVIDRAIVRFDEESLLPKFQLNPSHTKIYIPQNGMDYAVVHAQAEGELPVNFKAENNGRYTLSVDIEKVSFDYLHLIDNMTGADVDLLATPTYTFDARTTDYASRFKLVFAATGIEENPSTGSGTFAYNNGSEWVIANPSTGSGTATLQVVDMMGRVLSSETISGSCSKAINVAPGVYMLRLINGNDVKVQKIVVR